DRGVGTAARLDADDALGRQGLVGDEELRVFFRVDVVRHDRDIEAVARPLPQGERGRGVAGTARAANADAKRHDRNSLLYCVSCRAESSARFGAKFHRCWAVIEIALLKS